jgi:hypothetical protein
MGSTNMDNGGFIMKARLLQLATVLLIGITLAGCAGTGMKQGSYEGNPQVSQGPWPAPTIESEGLR